jgi:hypothetical protein
VCNRGEAVAPSHSANPFFDLRGFYLDRATARPAHKMMMMIVGLAQSVEGFTLGRCNDVNLSGIGMGLQIPIDGRQPDAGGGVAQLVIRVPDTAPSGITRRVAT